MDISILEAGPEELDEAEEISACKRCGASVPTESLTEVDGDCWCEECFNTWTVSCDECSAIVASQDTHVIHSGRTICQTCRDDSYFRCPGCGELYHYDDSYSDDGGDYFCSDCFDDRQPKGSFCEAPNQSFEFDAAIGTISNDQTFKVSIPGGILSDQGKSEIHLVVKEHLVRLLDEEIKLELGPEPDFSEYYAVSPEERQAMMDKRSIWNGQRDIIHDRYYGRLDAWNHYWNETEEECYWQTKAGNLTKRIAKAGYSMKVKFPSDLISQIGNIAQQHCAKEPTTYELTLTRDLNQDRDQFMNGGSCWWTDYSRSRCILKQSGGMGLRTWETVQPPLSSHWDYGSHSYVTYQPEPFERVSGRIWAMPLVKRFNHYDREVLVANTGSLDETDCWILFNAYGQSGFTFARLFALALGQSYRKVKGFHPDHMYVNEALSFLVGPEELIHDMDSVDVVTTDNCDCNN